jgi:lysophospholipase L1-like esterase
VQHPDQVDRRTADADGSAPVVLLGASYVAAWPLSEIGGRPVINRGIPGNQTHEYLARFDRDVVALRPSAVVIWGIDNDIIRAPAGGADKACEDVERNLAALVDRSRACAIEPFLVTDMTLRPPRRWYEGLAALAGRIRGKQGYQDRINAYVLRLNVAIRGLAERTGAGLLDLHPLLSAPDGWRARAFAQQDGSHLTEAAYGVIDAYAKPRIAARLDEVAVRRTREPRVRAAGAGAASSR